MSDARLMQILASLARRSPLRTLHTICETQHQISTRKLEQYLEPIGDELAGFAFNLRQDYDQLHAANQRLEGEVARLKMEFANAGNPLSNVAYNLAQKVGQPLTEYDCQLLSELRKRWDAALSTANGEVTE